MSESKVEVGASQPLLDALDEFVRLRLTKPSSEELEEKLSQIKVLIASNNVNQSGDKDQMPLVVAARIGEPRIIQWMLDKGALVDIHNKDNWEFTPLINAVVFEREESVQLLLEKRASVHEVDKMGKTALHKAAALGNEQIVDLLLKYDADPMKRDLKGFSSLDIAKENRNTQILKVMRQKPFEIFLHGLGSKKGPLDSESNIHLFFSSNSSGIYEKRLIKDIASFMFPLPKPQSISNVASSTVVKAACSG